MKTKGKPMMMKISELNEFKKFLKVIYLQKLNELKQKAGK